MKINNNFINEVFLKILYGLVGGGIPAAVFAFIGNTLNFFNPPMPLNGSFLIGAIIAIYSYDKEFEEILKGD